MGKNKKNTAPKTLDNRSPKESVTKASSAIKSKGIKPNGKSLDTRTPEQSKNLATKAVTKANGTFKTENNLDSRTPESSVTDALGKIGTKIEPGVNPEIKDIVADILNGKLKTVMDNSSVKVNEEFEDDEEIMDEKELILGGKGENASDTPPMDDIDGKLAEMGYGDDEEVDVDLNVEETGLNPHDDVSISPDHDGTLGDYLTDDSDLELDGEIEADRPAMEMPIDVEVPVEVPTENPMDVAVQEPVEVPVDVEQPMEMPVEGEDTDFKGMLDSEEQPEIETMSYDDLTKDDQLDVDGAEASSDELSQNIMDELNAIDEAVLPAKTKEKLAVYFEMLAEEKAKIISTKKVATVIDETSKYMEYVVKEYVGKKDLEIKEAIESVKKNEIYENMTFMIEKLYGKSSTDILEAKKVEDFLTNVISEMKVETDKLENIIAENKEDLEKMKCSLIFNEATKNMVMTDKTRIANFMESFDVSNSGDFKTKLGIVIEKFNVLTENKKEKVSAKPNNRKRTPVLNEEKIQKAVVKNELLKEDVDVDEVIDPSNFNTSFYTEY